MNRKLGIFKRKKPQFVNTNLEIDSENEDGLIIFKRSLFTVVKKYLENSTLAGCKRIVEPKRHPVERLIWLVVICLAVYGAVYIVKLIWKDFVENPTVVSLESDQYPVWKVPFPAIAICDVNKLSKVKIQEVSEKLLSSRNCKWLVYNNETKELIIKGFRNLGKFIDYDSPTSNTFEEFVQLISGSDDVNSKSFNVRSLLEKFSPSCEMMLLRCQWMSKLVNCSELFKMRLTSEGFCCTFNYNPRSLSDGELGEPIYVRTPGPPNSLYVILDPRLEDYMYPTHSLQGFKVHVFYTYDYPDPHVGNTMVRFIPVGKTVFISVAVRTMHSVPGVKQFSIQRRKCMLRDDFPEIYNGKYSFSDCIFKCKKAIIRSLCKCTPFFMQSHENVSCGFSQLPCLYKYKDKFRTTLTELFDHNREEDSDEEPIDGVVCKDCYPDCDFIKYSAKVLANPLTKTGMNFKMSLNVTGKNFSAIRIFFRDVDTELYKLDVVFYWFEIVSDFGGICGLFLGLSLVSVFEMVYYLTIRLIDELHKNKFSFSKCF